VVLDKRKCQQCTIHLWLRKTYYKRPYTTKDDRDEPWLITMKLNDYRVRLSYMFVT